MGSMLLSQFEEENPICPSDSIVDNKHHWCTYEAVDE